MTHPESNSPRSTLSEHESKQLVARYGVPIATERVAQNADDAAVAATELGFPVVVKLCGDAIAHKTERDLVRLGLADADAVRAAAADLLAKARPEDGAVALLVAEMVRGKRELIAGLVRDPHFGPCVVLGLGGILTEALGDVVFAMAPIARHDALAMIDRLHASHLLTRPFRGEAAADADTLADVLVGLGNLAIERPDVASVDLNPLIVRSDGKVLAVDALVELENEARSDRAPFPRSEPQASGEVHQAGARTSNESRDPIVPRSEPQASGEVIKPSSRATKHSSPASARSSTRAASSSPAPPPIPASSASSRSTTCAPSATPARSSL